MWAETIAQLKTRLKGKLPGLEAQMGMAPYIRNPENFKLPDSEQSLPGGVLILIYPHNDELHIPMMLRPDYDGAHSGQVSFPGGKMEPHDHDLIATSLRESEEEMGIPSSKVEIIGSMSSMYISVSNYKVLPVVGFLDHRPDFVKDPIEVEEIIETPISHLLLPDTVKEKDIRVSGGFQLKAPYFEVEHHTVWGATAMMLNEFLTVYKDL
jgi:8-oxo-dGTP pyrophosphatase MutT (NUDIX family)